MSTTIQARVRATTLLLNRSTTTLALPRSPQPDQNLALADLPSQEDLKWRSPADHASQSRVDLSSTLQIHIHSNRRPEWLCTLYPKCKSTRNVDRNVLKCNLKCNGSRL